MNAQTEILQILFNNDKSKTWLSQKLGISPQNLDYKLNKASDLPLIFYNEIMAIFKKEGFITSAKDQCDYLLRQTITIDSMIGNMLSILNDTVERITEDHVLDFKEKMKLSELTDKIKMNFNNELEKIQNIIEGRRWKIKKNWRGC